MSIPINWCCQMIREQIHNKDRSVCIDAGDLELRGSVTKYYEKLFLIYNYKTHPLPSICSDAIFLAIFVYALTSGIALQPCGRPWKTDYTLDEYQALEKTCNAEISIFIKVIELTFFSSSIKYNQL